MNPISTLSQIKITFTEYPRCSMLIAQCVCVCLYLYLCLYVYVLCVCACVCVYKPICTHAWQERAEEICTWYIYCITGSVDQIFKVFFHTLILFWKEKKLQKHKQNSEIHTTEITSTVKMRQCKDGDVNMIKLSQLINVSAGAPTQGSQLQNAYLILCGEQKPLPDVWVSHCCRNKLS